MSDAATVLFTEEAIHRRVHELGALITRDYRGKSPVLVSVLKGGVVFLADLFREIEAAEAKYDRADRDEAEELYGDYQDLVETGTEVLADLRDHFASSLGEQAAEQYEAEFHDAVRRDLPRFALEIEDR